ncbi:MAG: hypothetical protein FWB78_12810 [Treponema sp.]|nr:hypothetical protein [Treponema sp.]
MPVQIDKHGRIVRGNQGQPSGGGNRGSRRRRGSAPQAGPSIFTVICVIAGVLLIGSILPYILAFLGTVLIIGAVLAVIVFIVSCILE